MRCCTRCRRRSWTLLLRLPIVSGIVKKKILNTLGLDQCVMAISGAAPIPAELLRWYARIGLKIAEGYGLTENCALSHITTPGEDIGTVGRTYDGVECRTDPASGEILVKSAATMTGYYRQPELTRAGVHRRRLPAHRRQGRDRRAWRA